MVSESSVGFRDDPQWLQYSYLLQQFSLRTHEVTPFANKKNSMRTMLDQSGSLTLWYTGEEIVVFDFVSNAEVWRETVKCKKSKDPNFAYYCFGMLSPRQSKAAYRVTEGEYVLVDLKSAQKVVIPNAGWHPFFSPDDQCFSVGGKHDNRMPAAEKWILLCAFIPQGRRKAEGQMDINQIARVRNQ